MFPGIACSHVFPSRALFGPVERSAFLRLASILRCDTGCSPAEFSGDGWIGRFCEVSDEDMPKLSKRSCECAAGDMAWRPRTDSLIYISETREIREEKSATHVTKVTSERRGAWRRIPSDRPRAFWSEIRPDHQSKVAFPCSGKPSYNSARIGERSVIPIRQSACGEVTCFESQRLDVADTRNEKSPSKFRPLLAFFARFSGAIEGFEDCKK